MVHCILVPRGRAPFGQHQESRPLAKPLAGSKSGSPRFTDFPSLCACSEKSLTNLIGSGLNLLCLHSPFKSGMSLDRARGSVAILGAAQSAQPPGTRMTVVYLFHTLAERRKQYLFAFM